MPKAWNLASHNLSSYLSRKASLLLTTLPWFKAEVYIDICILILYLAILLNFFFNYLYYIIFYIIMPPVNNDYFIFLF